ncbi:scavenger mrna decapping enzyme [Lentinula edodes]|uniref:Scavenger mrna decapping enzyme n=1 Tax=Lentinula edodes TaxID=5353 RepID=A0A1Q3DXL5_LENED|nr:scavenger mrna decapping enzyme [Lentinula edodes]
MPDLSILQSFELSEILSEEPDRCRLTLLGYLPSTWNASTDTENRRLRAIILIERNAFASEHNRRTFEQYSWFAAWISSQASEIKQPQGDVKINVICPATDVHVRKYTKQKSILVQETPELYRRIIAPYIANLPPERTRWVTEILAGRSEQDKVLYSSSDYIILPDMKWDLHTTDSLYLIAIARDPTLRSLRDLRGDVHLSLLTSIRQEAYRIVGDKWGIGRGGIRMWIHYQPSYYHFHVHIVNANHALPGMGMAVGQAHLLEDVIALLKINSDVFKVMDLTYGLGEQHGLYEPMKTAQSEVDWIS